MADTSNTVTVRSTGIKYGLIVSLISILFFVILSVSGVNAFDNKWSWVNMLFSIVLLVLAHKSFKDEGTGYMTYGQGVGIGFWMTLTSLILGGLFTYVYTNIIDPAAMDEFYDMQVQQMEEKGMPEDQIEMAMGWTKKLFWPMYVFFGMFFGLLVAVIVTIFTQKKSPETTF